jgi:cytochrome c biogenesis protein CcmG, thiol:disulfide interchange protein DsbE
MPMKKLFLAAFTLVALVSATVRTAHTLPSASVKTIDGKPFNTAEISNDGKPIIISFWATWCKPCKKELDAISENYKEWQDETGVKLVAISIDDARSMANVGKEVKAKGWEFEVYLDSNQDFKRAMNVNNVPHTFLLNGKGEIVYQHNSYAEGDEEKLYEKVKKVAKGEKVDK